MKPRGKYIVIEGSDGTGKTTQVEALCQYLQQKGITCAILHEPGSTPIGQQLRKLITDKDLPRLPLTNVLMFTAARHELTPVIDNHLAAGHWVVASRNWLSTVAYQGYGEGVDIELIEQITRQFTSPVYIKPDATIILSAEQHARQNRLTERDGKDGADIFESKPSDFQARLHTAYQAIAKKYSLALIDTSNKSIDKVAKEILGHIDFL